MVCPRSAFSTPLTAASPAMFVKRIFCRGAGGAPPVMLEGKHVIIFPQRCYSALSDCVLTVLVIRTI